MLDGPRDWHKRPFPRVTRACFRTKAEALKAFEAENLHVTEPWGLETRDCASMDAVNERYNLKGRRRACTLAEALWHALPPGAPFCLESTTSRPSTRRGRRSKPEASVSRTSPKKHA